MVTKGKTLVTYGKTLVTEEKTLVTKGKVTLGRADWPAYSIWLIYIGRVISVYLVPYPIIILCQLRSGG